MNVRGLFRRNRFAGLRRHPDFLKLWAGQTVSMVGSRVTLLALPLTAILTLHASPLQIGLLGAVESAACSARCWSRGSHPGSASGRRSCGASSWPRAASC